MSYDLFFYRSKGKGPDESTIRKYLSANLVNLNGPGNQWFFTNKDTGVYYSVEYSEPDAAEMDEMEEFDEFEPTNFAFNLNFIRPSFFGLEAFAFVETFLEDLGLFVLNPQMSFETPVTTTAEELYDNWNTTNLRVSADYIGKMNGTYMPIEQSNEAWRYNFHKRRLQVELGENYFVPQLLILRKGDTAVTLAVWPEHLPMVVPRADYYLLARQYKRLFKTIKEEVVITRETLMKNFESFFDEFSFDGCYIIHPQNAEKARGRFNSVKADEQMGFAERLPIDKLFNVA